MGRGWDFSFTSSGSTQPPTEMGTRESAGRQLVHRADNLTTFMCRLFRNSESLNLLEPYKS
jgi:hypothetical protein